MEKKKLNLNNSVYELCKENPELPELLAQLGFTDITKPGMLQTAGRFMTIPKGATLKKLNLEQIKQTLAAKGYEIIG
jgi:N-dimethylarginine dimethylaminohydrolase